MSANGDARDLERDLAAANQAIESLIKEASASESRANALSENAWRWVFRYRRVQRALRRLTGRTSGTAQPLGTNSVQPASDSRPP